MKLGPKDYRAASILVAELRSYVIGQSILDEVSLAAAIVSGNLSAGDFSHEAGR